MGKTLSTIIGNGQTKPNSLKPPVQVEKPMSTIIKHVEKKLLISWTSPITKEWFEYHLIKSNKPMTQLLQAYIDKLCVEYGFDGYGISLMNEEFFINMSFNIINELKEYDISRFKHVITYLHRKSNAQVALDINVMETICNYDSSLHIIYETKSIIQSFYTKHIIRIQKHFNKEYPSTETKRYSEPNMVYLQQILNNKNSNMQYKLLEWFHYQTEHRVGYASRTQSRIWILQPSTCKRYYGLIKLIPLKKFNTLTDLQNKENISDPLYKSVLFSHRNESKQLSFESISCFIWYSLCLSSSKDSFHNFAMPKGAFSKRVNASSGGLHPVECYFILPSNIINKCINNQWLFCHYPVRAHGLEILGSFEQKSIENNAFFIFYILVSAVDFRETWKYGERGLRYSLLDIGHALSALCIICNLMGWKCSIVANVSFNELKSKFDLPAADHPRMLLRINCCPNNINIISNDINILSTDCILNKKEYITECYTQLGVTWPILGIIEKHCLLGNDYENVNGLNNKWIDCNIALHIKDKNIFSNYCNSPNYALRHRRSALEFDVYEGKFNMFKDACFLMKNMNFPFKRLCCYILYVIRIENIESGLYLLFPTHAEKYENMYKEYIEKTMEQKINVIELMNELYIYQNKKIDEKTISKMSKNMACHQNLCSNASFTIDFCVDMNIAMENGYNYSTSHFECGYIGQLLYIHMECIGLGATAIGCYLDDYASSNVNFIPKPQQEDNENISKISPIDLKRFDDYNHPLKNVRSLCHFSCGTPSNDLRYPYYAFEHELFPLDE